MAKFWKLQYHKDDVEKHNITKEEVEFLKNLQKEMNTQDNVGQANPRYWVIRDYGKIYGENLNNADGITVYDADACKTIFEIEYRFFQIQEMTNKVIEALEKDEYDLSEEDRERIANSYDLGSLCEALEEMNFTVLEYEEYPIEKGFFLTHKAAQEHLRLNHYHYSDAAHTYAHTAWRSCEEKLWDILQKVDFNSLD